MCRCSWSCLVAAQKQQLGEYRRSRPAIKDRLQLASGLAVPRSAGNREPARSESPPVKARAGTAIPPTASDEHVVQHLVRGPAGRWMSAGMTMAAH